MTGRFARQIFEAPDIVGACIVAEFNAGCRIAFGGRSSAAMQALQTALNRCGWGHEERERTFKLECECCEGIRVEGVGYRDLHGLHWCRPG